MKCISCDANNNRKSRVAQGGRCARCGHRFVFEPMATVDHPQFTDRFFKKAIEDITANNTLSFTRKQFHHFLDRRLKRRVYGRLGGNVLFGFVQPFVWALFPTFASILIFAGLLQQTAFVAPFNIHEDHAPLIFYLLWWVAAHSFFHYRRYLQLSRASNASAQVRRLQAVELQIIGMLITGVGAFWNSTTTLTSWLVMVAVGSLTVVLGTVQKRPTTGRSDSFLITKTQVDDWLNRWDRANGPIEQLLRPLPIRSTESESFRVDNESLFRSDITAYSFDRAVICQDDAIAQMLIANNFHFENNCAILSISGYPQRIFDTTMQMLRRNPALTVYAFHDCSPEGITLATQLRTDPKWFPNSAITIVDLGLSPRQILTTSQGAFVHNDKAIAAESALLYLSMKQSLSAEELTWLEAGNTVELESFTPQRLIRVLLQGISMSAHANWGVKGGFSLSNTKGAGIAFVAEPLADNRLIDIGYNRRISIQQQPFRLPPPILIKA